MASTMLLAGCGSLSDIDLPETILPDSGIGHRIVRALDELPFIYRPTINQGNIVVQDDLNKLNPGMTKRQAQFVLGTPMLVDVFHGDRWDYIYTTGVGSNPSEIKRVTLHFNDDRLTRVEGDLRPEAIDEAAAEKREIVVSVPDWEGDTRPWWKRVLGLGLSD